MDAGMYNHDPVVSYKREAIQAAKELMYGEDVIQKLKQCHSRDEIIRVMLNARKRGY